MRYRFCYHLFLAKIYLYHVYFTTTQNNISKEDFYSACFELIASDGKAGLKSYSKDPHFLNSISAFANADEIGSFYGLWLRDNEQDLKNAPIVIFGGEGGFHVVASNISDFFQILTYDAEPMVSWGRVYYEKEAPNFTPSKQHETFITWLFENFRISGVGNANDVVKTAQAKYQEAFKNWMKKFYDE